MEKPKIGKIANVPMQQNLAAQSEKPPSMPLHSFCYLPLTLALTAMPLLCPKMMAPTKSLKV